MLLIKPEELYLKKESVALTESFLSNQQQRVKLNNTLLECIPIKLGVPSDTIIGPIFILALHK